MKKYVLCHDKHFEVRSIAFGENKAVLTRIT